MWCSNACLDSSRDASIDPEVSVLLSPACAEVGSCTSVSEWRVGGNPGGLLGSCSATPGKVLAWALGSVASHPGFAVGILPPSLRPRGPEYSGTPKGFLAASGGRVRSGFAFGEGACCPAYPGLMSLQFDPGQKLRPIDFDSVGPAVGSQFPDIELPDQNGSVRSLKAIRGGGPAMIVVFRSADW